MVAASNMVAFDMSQWKVAFEMNTDNGSHYVLENGEMVFCPEFIEFVLRMAFGDPDLRSEELGVAMVPGEGVTYFKHMENGLERTIGWSGRRNSFNFACSRSIWSQPHASRT